MFQAQKTFGMRNSDLCEIFQGGNPHFFFEELAEIVGVHVDMGDGLIQIVIGVRKVGDDLVDGGFHAGMMRNQIRKGREIVKKHVVQTVHDLGVILALQLVFVIEPGDHRQEVPRVGVSDLDPGVVREGDVLKFIVDILEAVVGVVGVNTTGRKEENISRFKANKSPVDLHRSGTLGIAHHLPIGMGMQMIDPDRCVDTSRKFHLAHCDSLLLLRDGFQTLPLSSLHCIICNAKMQ